MSIQVEDLRLAFQSIRSEASALAGEPDDIPDRVALLFDLFLQSKQNHPFPMVALHGALWAHNFFNNVERILRASPMSEGTRQDRLDTLHRFTRLLKEANREVFVDTYSTYMFTRQFGHIDAAAEICGVEFLELFRQIHAASDNDSQLTPDQSKTAFSLCLNWEQSNTVSPRISEEALRIDCPVLSAFCLRPVVRFSYFPVFTLLHFRNFAESQERIEKAMKSFDVAMKVGWSDVMTSAKKYNVLPREFFVHPAQYACNLRKRKLLETR